VAALMFRFNNPDALLVLLMTLAAYFTLRAVDDGRLRWMLWAGVMVGLGFLTKQLQVLLVVPPIALVFLWASPLKFGRRLLHAARRTRRDGRARRGGGSRSSSWCRHPCGPTSADRRPTPFWNSPSATTASVA
jgi:Dolichyl-phosphate-mannose-protein mannosyltransferase.